MSSINWLWREQFKGLPITEPDLIAAQIGFRKACREFRAKATNDPLSLDFVISDSGIDRDLDRILIEGWDLKAFRENPVVLFAHRGDQPPIATATRTRREGDQLVARAKFMPRDMSEFSHSIFRMYEEGFLRATSVGFRPLELEFVEDEKRIGGIDFYKQELLEFSAVPVPANPRALIRAHEQGIDTSHLKDWMGSVLDDQHDRPGLSRDQLEEAWKALTTRPVISFPGQAGADDQVEKDQLTTAQFNGHAHGYEEGDTATGPPTDPIHGTHMHGIPDTGTRTDTAGDAMAAPHFHELPNRTPPAMAVEGLEDVEFDEPLTAGYLESRLAEFFEEVGVVIREELEQAKAQSEPKPDYVEVDYIEIEDAKDKSADEPQTFELDDARRILRELTEERIREVFGSSG